MNIKTANIIDPDIKLAIGESFTTFSEYKLFQFDSVFQLDATHGGGYIDLFNSKLSISKNKFGIYFSCLGFRVSNFVKSCICQGYKYYQLVWNTYGWTWN